MRILVIDTATQALSVALFDEERLLAGTHSLVGRGHAEALLPAVAALPDGGRADSIAVDVGPGSFTGVRVGVAAARALALAWQIPVHGYTSLSLIAAQARDGHDSGPIAVTITGGHGELFWQLFDRDDVSPLDDLASTPIADLAALLDMPRIYGTGAHALVAARGHGDAVEICPDARVWPAIRTLPPLAARPVYGRGADARPMAGASA